MRREIYAYRCRRCDAVQYPFRMVCKACRQNDFFEFDPVPLPRRGTLLTFTHVHNLPLDFAVARLGLGIVELENGLRITGQLDVAEPKIGMAVEGEVEVVRRADYDEYHGMVFRAA
ncbi:MAG: DNA-binding protein [Gemmatimonadetes bacterium]|nr:DNA-binding protein [Gemmatimonadota bacterium]